MKNKFKVNDIVIDSTYGRCIIIKEGELSLRGIAYLANRLEEDKMRYNPICLLESKITPQ
jgi:hypothetical protein